MRVKSDKCSMCKTALRSATHRYCAPCKAAYMRDWRPTHPMSEESRKKHNARCYLRMYIKRGLTQKDACKICQSPFSKPYFKDLSKPLEVDWLCNLHKPL